MTYNFVLGEWNFLSVAVKIIGMTYAFADTHEHTQIVQYF